jgi:hypothetical protein
MSLLNNRDRERQQVEKEGWRKKENKRCEDYMNRRKNSKKSTRVVSEISVVWKSSKTASSNTRGIFFYKYIHQSSDDFYLHFLFQTGGPFSSVLCFEMYACRRLQMWRQKKSWQVKRRHWYQWIGLYSLFEKTPIITPEKRTVQPGGAFEDTAFKPGFEIVKL